MGIDPGTAIIGWSVVEGGFKPHALAYGAITTHKETPAQERLLRIHDALTKLIARYEPDEVAMEDLFFATNAKTAIAVGQARGVLILACAEAGIPVISYSPLTVKSAICGYGKADKKQVQSMVTRLFGLKETPKPDDIADALAIALTHASSAKLKEHTL